MDPDYNAIGVRVRSKRLLKNLSQFELASEIGVSNPHISNIERGRTKVSLPTLINIANALEVTLDELVCDNVHEAKSVFIKEIDEEVKSCDTEEVKIVASVVKVLVQGMKARKSEQ